MADTGICPAGVSISVRARSCGLRLSSGRRINTAADDAAGLLAFLFRHVEQGGSLDKVYIGVDDAPAPLAEVVAWLREYLGVTEWSEDASVRRTGSKRCSNARAKALGWTPKYPSYREGYAAILEGRC